MATTDRGVTSPTRARIDARTLRQDRWWLSPLATFVVFSGFVVFATVRAFMGRDYYATPYLSPFYSPCLGDCVEGRNRGLQGGRVAHPHILAGRDDDAPGDEAGVLPRLQLASQVVQGRVDVGATHRLDERARHGAHVAPV